MAAVQRGKDKKLLTNAQVCAINKQCPKYQSSNPTTLWAEVS